MDNLYRRFLNAHSKGEWAFEIINKPEDYVTAITFIIERSKCLKLVVSDTALLTHGCCRVCQTMPEPNPILQSLQNFIKQDNVSLKIIFQSHAYRQLRKLPKDILNLLRLSNVYCYQPEDSQMASLEMPNYVFCDNGESSLLGLGIDSDNAVFKTGHADSDADLVSYFDAFQEMCTLISI